MGPVAEGFVGLFVGVGACLLAALWVGDRTEAEEDEDREGHSGHEVPATTVRRLPAVTGTAEAAKIKPSSQMPDGPIPPPGRRYRTTRSAG